MKNFETTILQSKLKRHKISYTAEYGKIIIGKSKADLTTIIGLILFPILAALIISVLLISNKVEIFEHNFTKIIVAITVLLGIGMFNLKRVLAKIRANNTIKTLDYKSIKIKRGNDVLTFNSKNIDGFAYNVSQIKDDVFEANLYLVDIDLNKHQILGFDESNEQYANDDLEWFIQFLIKHLKVKKSTNTF